MTAHEGAGHAVAIRPNGKKIASVGQDGLVKLWDDHLSSDFKSLKLHSSSASSLDFNFDGSLLVLGDS